MVAYGYAQARDNVLTVPVEKKNLIGVAGMISVLFCYPKKKRAKHHAY